MYKKHLKRSRKRLLSKLAWRIRTVFWTGAILVGVVATCFAMLSEQAEHGFHQFSQYSPYVSFFLPPIGLLLISWLTRKIFKGAEGSGIPQTIVTLQRKEQNYLRKSLLSLRVSIGKFVLTLLGLLSGLSIGREGPTVHIGASIMFSLGRFSRFPPHYIEKGLILAGGSAGVAAAFNTPVAGIVFAIEELSRSFEEKNSGIIFTAVVIAGITAISIQGSYTYFGSIDSVLPVGKSWWAIPFCGILGGLFGGLFSQSLIYGIKVLRPLIKKYPERVAVTCGLLISLIGLLSSGATFGTGYQQAGEIISGTTDYDPWFPILKVFATISSYLSGVPGGIFSPSLTAGAGFGANFYHWLPVAPYETMILLGMLAYFAGVIQSPITASVIVMEMTDNPDILLAMMATALIAHGTSRIVCPVPIYRAMATQFLEAQKRLAGTS
jgi:H+/Cl- antiporter ClcA